MVNLIDTEYVSFPLSAVTILDLLMKYTLQCAISINRSINLIIDYFNNRSLQPYLVHCCVISKQVLSKCCSSFWPDFSS